jgi:hypothetical protein
LSHAQQILRLLYPCRIGVPIEINEIAVAFSKTDVGQSERGVSFNSLIEEVYGELVSFFRVHLQIIPALIIESPAVGALAIRCFRRLIRHRIFI